MHRHIYIRIKRENSDLAPSHRRYIDKKKCREARTPFAHQLDNASSASQTSFINNAVQIKNVALVLLRPTDAGRTTTAGDAPALAGPDYSEFRRIF